MFVKTLVRNTSMIFNFDTSRHSNHNMLSKVVFLFYRRKPATKALNIQISTILIILIVSNIYQGSEFGILNQNRNQLI